jgi:hypothetical protein
VWWGYEAAGFAETEKARRGQERGASLNRRCCGENDEGQPAREEEEKRGGAARVFSWFRSKEKAKCVERRTRDSPVIIASSAGAVEATVGLVYQKEEEEKDPKLIAENLLKR